MRLIRLQIPLALVLAALGGYAWGQTTYSPGVLPSFSSVTGIQQTVSIGDTLSNSFTSGLSTPSAAQVAAHYDYNFVDLYQFTTPTASAAADTIELTFAGQVTNPQNVQIAIFTAGTGDTIALSQWNGTGLSTSTYTPSGTGYTYGNVVGSTSGAVNGGGWTLDSTSTINVGGVTDTVVTLSNVALGAGTYFLEVRGLASTGAAYSGNLAIVAVPEPQSWALMLAALPAIALFHARRRRADAREAAAA